MQNNEIPDFVLEIQSLIQSDKEVLIYFVYQTIACPTIASVPLVTWVATVRRKIIVIPATHVIMVESVLMETVASPAAVPLV